jgi:hypothetical protein
MELNEDDLDLAELKEKQERANLMKGVLSGAGGMLQAQANVPSAYEYLHGKVGQPTDFKGTFDGMASNIKDPMDTSRKAMEYMKQKREQRQMRDADDVNSGDADTYRKQLYALAPTLNGKLEGMTLAQMERTSPILMAKIKGDVDRANAQTDAERRASERAEDKRFKLMELEMKAGERKDAKEAKQKEMNAAQSKQRGLYEMGKKAEEQFSKATSDPGNYDPTGVGQVIDNSEWAPNWMKNNKAVEAQSAMSAWVESYLRDASGAAIPPSERMNYAKDFFPMPGDTPDVVANKQALRAQKMENARMGSGLELGHGPAETAVATRPAQSKKELAIAELAKRKAAKSTAGR